MRKEGLKKEGLFLQQLFSMRIVGYYRKVNNNKKGYD
jgi:hypothetical protein